MTKPQHEPLAIRIHGKYLVPLEKFCRSLVVDSTQALLNPVPEYDEFKALMLKLYGAYLTPENVDSIIFREVFFAESGWGGRAGPLASAENEDILQALVLKIKEFFESIPRACTLRIQLPQFPVFSGAVKAFAEDVQIVIDKPTVPTLLAAALRGSSPAPTPDSSAWLEIRVLGYGDFSSKSPAPSTCLSVAKQCAFIMSAFGLCLDRYTPYKARATFSDAAGRPFSDMEIPESVSRLFSRLKPDDSKLVFHDPLVPGKGIIGGLLTQEPRPPVNDEETVSAFDQAFADVGRYFASRSNEDFGQIAAAIEWYEDSVWADNDTFAYIAACVGLEAVIGSTDEHLDNLTKRLADRYAFLMGSGRKDRERLMKEYSAVLKLRGRLVHGKAARLAADERHLLLKAQSLLLDVIWQEVRRIRPPSGLEGFWSGGWP